MTSKLFSLRLRPSTLEQLEALARETDEPKSRLVQRFVEEGVRMARHPDIMFRDGMTGRRATLCGAPDVWEIIDLIQKSDGTPEEAIETAAEVSGLPVRTIQAAVRYYADYQEEIDDRIRRNREAAERWKAEHRRIKEVLAR